MTHMTHLLQRIDSTLVALGLSGVTECNSDGSVTLSDCDGRSAEACRSNGLRVTLIRRGKRINLWRVRLPMQEETC